MKKIEVVAAIIVRNGRIFATQRGYGEWEGWWEFPGGKIERGETPEEALVREIREELATEIVPDRFLCTVEHDYPTFHLTMHCYICHVVSGELVLLEHKAARWLKISEINEINWLPADMKIFSNILTERQKSLAKTACLEAQGDLVRLEPAIAEALDNGVTVNEIKETFSQLYAYTGFPRSLNALGVLAKVLKTPKAEWKEGEKWQRPYEWDNARAVFELGVKNQTQLSGRPFDYAFCPQDDFYLKSHLFGSIFAGKTLSHADRELVTVAALSGLKGVAPQLAAHKAGAVNMGNSKETVDALCMYLSEQGLSQSDNAADANAGSWPKGNPNVNYAKFFVGDSFLAGIRPKNLSEGEKTVLPMSNVTFEPGCRNNWHIHHGARQILICVSGEGWYQEWMKPAVRLKAGDVIDIPEGVKHWHGATKDSWFQHIATHVSVENTQPGSAPNEWLEPVSDADYNKLEENA